jgi:hypothetical protein
MTLQPQMLAGEWDVYSNGAHSILTLLPAGTFTHMLWGGVQGYWGHWSLQQAPEGPVIQFNLAGAQPQVYYGPNGPQTMQWPQQESWLITGIAGNQITTTDSILVRRGVLPFAQPGFAAPAPQFQPQFQPGPQPFAPPQPEAPPFVPQFAAPQPAVQLPPPQQVQPAQQQQTQPPNALAAAQQAAANDATADQIRQIYSSMAQQDSATTANITAQWTDLHNQQIGVIQAQNLTQMQDTHNFARAFTLYAGS